MPYQAPRLPCLPEEPLPPPPPVSIARAPRSWLTRAAGECAFPVDGEGKATRACCNRCPSGLYCAVHLALIRR